MPTYPVLLALGVSIFRRSGNTFTPIGAGSLITPGEAIRLQSTGGLEFGFVRFVVKDIAGLEVFNTEVFASAFGVAWIDTAAPSVEGIFTLTAMAQAVPFLGLTHSQSTTFTVSVQAPPPIKPPPGNNLFGDLKDTVKWLVVGAVAVGAVVVVSKFKK